MAGTNSDLWISTCTAQTLRKVVNKVFVLWSAWKNHQDHHGEAQSSRLQESNNGSTSLKSIESGFLEGRHPTQFEMFCIFWLTWSVISASLASLQSYYSRGHQEQLVSGKLLFWRNVARSPLQGLLPMQDIGVAKSRPTDHLRRSMAKRVTTLGASKK